MNNPFQLTFTLKQHTPIIHFQYEQAGATLRASEVKPKLDEFIMKELLCTQNIPIGFDVREAFKKAANNPLNEKQAQWKNWLIGKGKNEHVALDYKILIPNVAPIENYPKDIPEQFPLFFGNIKKEENKKKLFVFNNKINVNIHSFNQNLLSEIAKQLLPFFERNNFGTRQSKGFGSFYIESSSPYLKDYQIKYHLPSLKFSFKVNCESSQNYFKFLFKNIDLFYRSLRSGINIKSSASYTAIQERPIKIAEVSRFSNFYFKPLIFLYAKNSLGCQWDKKSIKQSYLPNMYYDRKPYEKEKEKLNFIARDKIRESGLASQIVQHNSDILNFSDSTQPPECRLDFKDLFGLSTVEDWKSYGIIIKKISAIPSGNCEHCIPYDEHNKDKIVRYKSPIMFKPIQTNRNEFTIFFESEKISNQYAGQKFIISDGWQNNLCLQIPVNFSFDLFFSYCFNKANFNIDTYLDANSKQYNDGDRDNFYRLLKNIYSQLQSQQ